MPDREDTDRDALERDTEETNVADEPELELDQPEVGDTVGVRAEKAPLPEEQKPVKKGLRKKRVSRFNFTIISV